jgi:hypothetical protein
MKDSVPRDGEGFDIVINGANRWFADLELSVIASAGFTSKTTATTRS